jgi:anti-anti-sigma regulatory factor
LPENLIGKQRSEFLREIRSCFDVDRPCLVLECSKLGHLDKQIVFLLLCCLEEAMKRNGDVRLAGLSPGAKAELKAADAHTLFRCFETTAEAVESFRRRAVGLSLHISTQSARDSAA